ncbi:hypothetical protein WA026_018133 [Henosepilachna vigintioctopunctata]|uniref:Protein ABHD13 n=1 Tax=Henosepilachna vigintioctopunctata TaxID=420089 RepID=A0AAW1UL19_9CUCU
MSRFTLKQFCFLFCCPPCPSSVAAKIAFLPPDPSYQFQAVSGSKHSIILKENAHWMYSEADLRKLEGFFVRTKRGNKIACVFVRYGGKPRFTLLFSHGNAVDLGQCSNYYVWLCSQLKCDIMSYDYSGYGISGGTPYERNLYSDIEAVWCVLRNRYNVNPAKVILYGYSIGTVPTIHLAAKNRVAGVVIHSGLMSGLRMAFPDMNTTLCCDPFPSVDRVRNIDSPTLIIHGTDDDIIDFSHGLGLHSNCPTAVAPLWVDGGGHNDLENRPVFLDRLKVFLNVDVSVD